MQTTVMSLKDSCGPVEDVFLVTRMLLLCRLSSPALQSQVPLMCAFPKALHHVSQPSASSWCLYQ